MSESEGRHDMQGSVLYCQTTSLGGCWIKDVVQRSIVSMVCLSWKEFELFNSNCQKQWELVGSLSALVPILCIILTILVLLSCLLINDEFESLGVVLKDVKLLINYLKI